MPQSHRVTEKNLPKNQPPRSLGTPRLSADPSRWVGPQSGPTAETGLEPVHERLMDRVSFAHQFEAGLVRRVATPIDSTPRLRGSVTLWPNTSENLGVLGGLGGEEFS